MTDDTLIFDLARVSCEENIPAGFEEAPPAPVVADDREPADPDMPF